MTGSLKNREFDGFVVGKASGNEEFRDCTLYSRRNSQFLDILIAGGDIDRHNAQIVFRHDEADIMGTSGFGEAQTMAKKAAKKWPDGEMLIVASKVKGIIRDKGLKIPSETIPSLNAPILCLIGCRGRENQGQWLQYPKTSGLVIVSITGRARNDRDR